MNSFRDQQKLNLRQKSKDLVSRNENKLYILERREEVDEKIMQVRNKSLIREEVLHSSRNQSKNIWDSEILYWKRKFHEAVDSLLNAQSNIKNQYDFHDEQKNFHDDQEYLSNSSKENDRNVKKSNLKNRRNSDLKNQKIENQNRRN